MPSQSIYRRPGAQHFQLVHRSQRDPLIHDAEASKYVLKSVERENAEGKGKTRADLDEQQQQQSGETNVGEAATYDIYYDDTEYDYMQHLRPIGVDEEGVDSVLLEAPGASSSNKTGKQRTRDNGGVVKLKHPVPPVVPSEVLPSKHEHTLEETYEASRAIPSAISGFQPDMDPHLRQTLEALEDEAFVDDSLQDNFFGELIKDGERKEAEDPGFEFSEEGEGRGKSSVSQSGPSQEEEEEEESWEARFSKFKKKQQQLVATPRSDDDSDMEREYERSETQDTVRTLPRLPVIGGKRRRKGASDASGYSLTSSSMYRNEGLTTLDERFAKVEQEYESDEDEDLDDEAAIQALVEERKNAPDLIPVRNDFESLMDDFLDHYEVIGGKMRPVLEGGTGLEKLETLRNALVDNDRRDVILGEGMREEDDDEAMPLPSIVGMGEDEDRWDVETILSTYSNLENHPGLIRLKKNHRVPQIHLDKRTGMPSASKGTMSASDDRIALRQEVLGANPDASPESPKIQFKRSKDESPEEKKERKQAAKDERRNRREERKVLKNSFAVERKNQAQIQRGRKIADTIRSL